MISFLKKLFSKREVIKQNDPDFGEIVYIDDVGKGFEPYWEMQSSWMIPEHKAKIQCVCIPGDSDGPYEYARNFLLSKRENLQGIWELCEEELIKQIDIWLPDHKHKKPIEIFTLDGINMDSEEDWEVCFESDSEYKWLYLGFQVKGSEIISGTVDT